MIRILLLAFFITTIQYESSSQSLVEALRNSDLFEKKKKDGCKPRSTYSDKKKSSAKKGSKKKGGNPPYQYVYPSKSAAPPTSSSGKGPVSNKQAAIKENSYKNEVKDDELVASATPTPVTSAPGSARPGEKAKEHTGLKNMDPEKRKVAVRDMTPTRELIPISFISDQDEFSVANMDSFMEALELINQGKMVLIEGHTDDLGNDDYNLKLSMKRVEKIRQIMLQAGANDNLISIIGYGEKKPVVPNTTEANRQKNRRIEFKIFEL